MAQLKQQKHKGASLPNHPVLHANEDVYPKLSLEYLKIKDNALQKDEILNIFKNLKDILQHTWRDISLLSKHGIGFELIPVTSLKCAIPQDDTFAKNDKVTVFHKHGDDIPLIGFRVNETYYLFCVDRDYKAYNH